MSSIVRCNRCLEQLYRSQRGWAHAFAIAARSVYYRNGVPLYSYWAKESASYYTLDADELDCLLYTAEKGFQYGGYHCSM